MPEILGLWQKLWRRGMYYPKKDPLIDQPVTMVLMSTYRDLAISFKNFRPSK